MKVVLPGEGGSTGIEKGEGMKMNEGAMSGRERDG